MKEKGITLIALIVTIIILIILAGITIGVLTGDEGLIGNANNAKEQTEIANEKEIVDRATINAMGNNPRGNIVEDELQNELDKITNVGDTDVENTGDEFEVVFVNTNRYYTVDKQGDIIDEGKIVIDKSPGDITKDENGDDIEEGQAYEIWCIEDLCAFSNMVNNGNHRFLNETVILMRTLDFNSKYSYVNGTITVEGNIKSCASIEELQKILTENEGFYPIGNESTNTSNFSGIFDGNAKKLENLYINRPNMIVGLFGKGFSAYIKDLEITGNITGNIAGGIIGQLVISPSTNIYKIENCTNNASITGKNSSGGIVGNRLSSEGKLVLANCTNNGIIKDGYYSGGIIGNAYSNVIILNSCNSGNISGGTNEGYSGVGGIVGFSFNNLSIFNSYNVGNIETINNGGGIIGYFNWGNCHIENCFNIANITGNTIGGIGGKINSSHDLLETENCYYLNANISNGFGNSNMESSEDINGISDTEMKSSEILKIFNGYVETNKEKESIELKKWINGKDDYPTFE